MAHLNPPENWPPHDNVRVQSILTSALRASKLCDNLSHTHFLIDLVIWGNIDRLMPAEDAPDGPVVSALRQHFELLEKVQDLAESISGILQDCCEWAVDTIVYEEDEEDVENDLEVCDLTWIAPFLAAANLFYVCTCQNFVFDKPLYTSALLCRNWRSCAAWLRICMKRLSTAV